MQWKPIHKVQRPIELIQKYCSYSSEQLCFRRYVLNCIFKDYNMRDIVSENDRATFC